MRDRYNIQWEEKPIKEVLKIFNRSFDQTVYEKAYEFCLFLFTYILTGLEDENDVTGELLLIKDQVMCSVVLNSLGYCEQSASQLRIAYEHVFLLAKKVLKLKSNKIGNISEQIELSLNNSAYTYDHELYYGEIYKNLSQSVHGPTPSYLSTDIEHFPIPLPYDQKLLSERYIIFYTAACEILFLIYEHVAENEVDQSILAHLKKFNSQNAQKIKKKYSS